MILLTCLGQSWLKGKMYSKVCEKNLSEIETTIPTYIEGQYWVISDKQSLCWIRVAILYELGCFRPLWLGLFGNSSAKHLDLPLFLSLHPTSHVPHSAYPSPCTQCLAPLTCLCLPSAWYTVGAQMFKEKDGGRSTELMLSPRKEKLREFKHICQGQVPFLCSGSNACNELWRSV